MSHLWDSGRSFLTPSLIRSTLSPRILALLCSLCHVEVVAVAAVVEALEEAAEAGSKTLMVNDGINLLLFSPTQIPI